VGPNTAAGRMLETDFTTQPIGEHELRIAILAIEAEASADAEAAFIRAARRAGVLEHLAPGFDDRGQQGEEHQTEGGGGDDDPAHVRPPYGVLVTSDVEALAFLARRSRVLAIVVPKGIDHDDVIVLQADINARLDQMVRERGPLT
jgi:hypothetical protein